MFALKSFLLALCICTLACALPVYRQSTDPSPSQATPDLLSSAIFVPEDSHSSYHKRGLLKGSKNTAAKNGKTEDTDTTTAHAAATEAAATEATTTKATTTKSSTQKSAATSIKASSTVSSAAASGSACSIGKRADSSSYWAIGTKDAASYSKHLASMKEWVAKAENKCENEIIWSSTAGASEDSTVYIARLNSEGQKEVKKTSGVTLVSAPASSDASVVFAGDSSELTVDEVNTAMEGDSVCDASSVSSSTKSRRGLKTGNLSACINGVFLGFSGTTSDITDSWKKNKKVSKPKSNGSGAYGDGLYLTPNFQTARSYAVKRFLDNGGKVDGKDVKAVVAAVFVNFSKFNANVDRAAFGSYDKYFGADKQTTRDSLVSEWSGKTLTQDKYVTVAPLQKISTNPDMMSIPPDLQGWLAFKAVPVTNWYDAKSGKDGKEAKFAKYDTQKDYVSILDSWDSAATNPKHFFYKSETDSSGKVTQKYA